MNWPQQEPNLLQIRIGLPWNFDIDTYNVRSLASEGDLLNYYSKNQKLNGMSLFKVSRSTCLKESHNSTGRNPNLLFTDSR